jgi:hypothetical protein
MPIGDASAFPDALWHIVRNNRFLLKVLMGLTNPGTESIGKSQIPAYLISKFYY